MMTQNMEVSLSASAPCWATRLHKCRLCSSPWFSLSLVSCPHYWSLSYWNRISRAQAMDSGEKSTNSSRLTWQMQQTTSIANLIALGWASEALAGTRPSPPLSGSVWRMATSWDGRLTNISSLSKRIMRDGLGLPYDKWTVEYSAICLTVHRRAISMSWLHTCTSCTWTYDPNYLMVDRYLPMRLG